MDKFRRIIDGGYIGFETNDARSIIRDSAEVTKYVESRLNHFNYVQQLMNDKIIDDAMIRVRSNGDFEYDGDGGFSYKPNSSRFQQRQIINEQEPSRNHQSYQTTPNCSNDVMARLDAMEREMSSLKEENRMLKSRIRSLK